MLNIDSTSNKGQLAAMLFLSRCLRLLTHLSTVAGDYVLYYKPGVPLAVIEAKYNNHFVSVGMPLGDRLTASSHESLITEGLY